MKTNIFKRSWPATRQASARCPAVLTVLLLAAASALAQPAVTTVSGGPNSTNANAFGYADGDTFQIAQFHTPMGLALGTDPSAGPILYVADRDNNAVRKLELAMNQTITFLTNKISHPVGVALDTVSNVYVLNRGNGNNGTVLECNRFGNFLGTNALNLVNANGIAVDSGTNIYVTVSSNQVVKIAPGSFPGVKTTVTTVTNAGTSLHGITLRAG